MLGALSMNEKAVAMKVEPGKADQGPSQGGVQDVAMQDPPSDSDSEDEHPSELSEEVMRFEKVIAEDN
eukprot:7455345-Alexandrium_andersonii.AAC.1